MNHIVHSVQLPADIQVYTGIKKVAKVKMVMNKSKVKGKETAGAMLTSSWSSVVDHNQMRVGDICVFWFRRSGDGDLKLLVDRA